MEPDPTRKHFEDLVDLPPADRRAALDALAEHAPEVADRVRALLDAHDRAGTFLQTPIASLEPLLRDATKPEQRGETVGRYRLISRLGEGSFSVVWLARQAEPFERDVALKLLKPGLDVQTIATRFDAERDALAKLEHPCIARIYDAGIHASGRPYFVMEHVPGPPITRYAEQHQLDARGIAQLAIAALRGVEHAHRQGIVHRDLKPANILVAHVDGSHEVKVIDFGIARAITPDRDAPQTLALIPAGSPAYMSPEQFQPGGVVTARSDVYSVGRILLELLAGRRVAHDESIAQRDVVLAARGVDRPLQDIVHRATEPQPEDRYASAAEFAEALRGYLAGEKVAPRRKPRARAPLGRRAAVALLVAGVLTAGLWWATAWYRGARTGDQLSNEAHNASVVTTPADAVFPAPTPLTALWQRPPVASGGWNSLIFSSKSRVVYGVSYQRDLEIIDLDTGVTTQSLRPDDRLVIRCALNRAGDRLAVATMDPDGGNQRIILLDATTLAEVNRFDIQGAVYAMDFVDAAGEVLAISLKHETDTHVAFYQSRTGSRTALGPVWRGSFAASYLLASGDDQTVLCNDISGTATRIQSTDGSVAMTYRAAAAGLTSINVAAESKLLLCSGHEAALLDLATGKLLARYQTPDAVTSANLTADGRRVVVGTLRPQLIAFDVATAQPEWVHDTPLDPRFPSNPVFQTDTRMVLMTSMDGSILAGRLPAN